VLTNCDSYDQFPPDALKKGAALSRRFPRLVRTLLGLQLRTSAGRRRGIATVTSGGLDPSRVESFLGPIRRDKRIAGDLVAALAGCRPQLMLDATEALPRFERPVLLVWGEACEFFPVSLARRLASDFGDATLTTIPGAKAWVPVDAPAALSDAIGAFVPTPVR
jgi:pimeloyl-ACP methyl ester carboxylesterase